MSMTLDENILAALKALTAGGRRDLFVLLTPGEGQYDSLAPHIPIPILVVQNGHERDGHMTRVADLREQHREVMLPCRPGSIEDLINLSVALALLEGAMSVGCRAVFVNMASKTDDCIIVLREITEASFEEWHTVIVSPIYPCRAIRDVLAVALELGRMRSRPAGALYLIGDTQNVLARSSQLFMNPFAGQSREHRDVADPRVRDTLREYARLDGAVIIDEDGLVQAAGVHVNADTRNVTLLVEGARHATAAAITHETKAIAVTVSEKSGAVTVFKGGKVILAVQAGKS